MLTHSMCLLYGHGKLSLRRATKKNIRIHPPIHLSIFLFFQPTLPKRLPATATAPPPPLAHGEPARLLLQRDPDPEPAEELEEGKRKEDPVPQAVAAAAQRAARHERVGGCPRVRHATAGARAPVRRRREVRE